MVDRTSILKNIRAAAPDTHDDDGFTIVEVMVAMMIFAIIFLGVASSTVTAVRMTADTRAREAAANLAAADIDAVRQFADPFLVNDTTYTEHVNGIPFTVRRDTGWVSASGTLDGCGSGTGSLQYKRVNVTVSWTGQLVNSSSARADTVLAPATRLNDPSRGSILISVLAVDGVGADGVGVTVTPTSGGAPLGNQPAPTDIDGCSYAFLVAPGSYAVRVSRPGYVGADQSATAEVPVTVTAGSVLTAAFQYDLATTYSLDFADNTGVAAVLPSDLDTTFFGAAGLYVLDSAPSTVPLHPFPSGYSAIAGEYVAPSESSAGCPAVDPGSWPAGTVNGIALAAGARADVVAAEPGGSKGLEIPMGLVDLTAGSDSVRIVAVPSPIASGDPGCSTGLTYTYTALPTTGQVPLAVPYGSWRIEELIAGVWTPVLSARTTVPTNAAGMIAEGDIVTVDPRPLEGAAE